MPRGWPAPHDYDRTIRVKCILHAVPPEAEYGIPTHWPKAFVNQVRPFGNRLLRISLNAGRVHASFAAQDNVAPVFRMALVQQLKNTLAA